MDGGLGFADYEEERLPDGVPKRKVIKPLALRIFSYLHGTKRKRRWFLPGGWFE